MTNSFTQFMNELKETNFSLADYVDFAKVTTNVESISIKLNQLNYLIGQKNIPEAVKLLWQENSNVFSVLSILIAVRAKDKKKVIDKNGEIRLIIDYFSTPEQVITFLNETGLTDLFESKQIKNLVDYVFGVEVGLDSNARKNRGGDIMENIIARLFDKHEIDYEREVSYTAFPEIVSVLGVDNKRFDFVIKTENKTYLIEANFYSSGGSKLNEVARSYSDIAPKINAVDGYEFVWITDGKGWLAASNKLEEAFNHIPNIYNLTSISTFITRIKGQ